MPDQPDMKRATLTEVEFDKDSGSRSTTKKNSNSSDTGSSGENGEGKEITVQFNPQTLKVTYKNQKANSDQPDGQGSHYVGRGTTQLSVDLLFDATRVDEVRDVREMTRGVRYFMEPKKQKKKKSDGGRNGSEDSSEKEVFVQRGVKFQWGTFTLEGVMDSLNETLEFFDDEGRPLRATVSIGITEHAIRLEDKANDDASSADWALPPVPSDEETGESPAEAPSSPDGDESRTSVQEMAGEAGRPSDWKKIAKANGIENPRAIRNPGALDLNP